jgi:ubiquinone biosynthesis protein COQ9
MLPLAGSRGWTREAMAEAAKLAGMSEGEVELAAPRGPLDLIDAFAERMDEEMLRRLEDRDFDSMRIRDRIRTAVLARLQAMREWREAERQGVSATALPLRAPSGAGRLWRTADRIWRRAGDRSTDENYYTKRAILAGVLAATTLRWLADESEDWVETRAFLDRRIEDVIRFEKLKASLLPLSLQAAGAVAGIARALQKGSART